MSNSNATNDQRRTEKETQAFKVFMRVAKKVQRLEYGKWKIVPDSIDPLRKFALVKSIGLVDIQLTLHLREFYHRGVYDSSRWDWHPTLAIAGLAQKSRYEDGLIATGLKIGPRAAKKIVEYVNENVTPLFYKELEDEKARAEASRLQAQTWLQEIAKVPGLTVARSKDTWNQALVGTLPGCNLRIDLATKTVTVSGEISYDELAVMTQRMGWGK